MPLFIICPPNFQHTFQEWFSLAWPVCCSHFLHADSIYDAKVVVAVAALIPFSSFRWSGVSQWMSCARLEKKFCNFVSSETLQNWIMTLSLPCSGSSHFGRHRIHRWYFPPWRVVGWLVGWLVGCSPGWCWGMSTSVVVSYRDDATAEARSELNRTRSVSLRHPTTKLPALFYRLSLGEGKERWKNGSDLISIPPGPASRAKVQYNRIDFESNAIRSNWIAFPSLTSLLLMHHLPTIIFGPEHRRIRLNFTPALSLLLFSTFTQFHSKESHCRSGNKLNSPSSFRRSRVVLTRCYRRCSPSQVIATFVVLPTQVLGSTIALLFLSHIK